ncbi:hypothetical protein WMF28_32645 [Sorangium sp. So ce590]|uniref:hypothetical protein n=1 Tax=Sorangium sp. So ce590 TaxID=3133317 RepID=UPI003F61D064
MAHFSSKPVITYGFVTARRDPGDPGDPITMIRVDPRILHESSLNSAHGIRERLIDY